MSLVVVFFYGGTDFVYVITKSCFSLHLDVSFCDFVLSVCSAHRPGVKQLPALSVIILIQGFEPVCRLLQPRAVQQILKGGRHVQILVDGEGHPVVKVLEKVIRPPVDGASWVVHGYLK